MNPRSCLGVGFSQCRSGSGVCGRTHRVTRVSAPSYGGVHPASGGARPHVRGPEMTSVCWMARPIMVGIFLRCVLRVRPRIANEIEQ